MFADAPLLLAGTGRLEEIGRRAADIVNISLEIWFVDQPAGFLQNRGITATGDNPALVEGDGTEIAAAKTTAMAIDAETHFLDGRHAALGSVMRMGQALEWQGKDPVQLAGGHGPLRRILDEKAVTVALDQGLAGGWVLLFILQAESHGIGQRISLDLIIRRQHDELAVLWTGILQQLTFAALVCFQFKTAMTGDKFGAVVRQLVRSGQEAGSLDFVDPARIDAFGQEVGDREDRQLAHAIDQQVGPAILEDAAPDLVRPVIIVGKAAQAGFDAADDQRDLAKLFADQVAVADQRPVRALAAVSAGRIAVVAAPLAGGRIIVDHRVDDAG